MELVWNNGIIHELESFGMNGGLKNWKILQSGWILGQCNRKKKKSKSKAFATKLKAFWIKKKHSINEILYYGIMENVEIMEVFGELWEDFEKVTKTARKKGISWAFATGFNSKPTFLQSQFVGQDPARWFRKYGVNGLKRTKLTKKGIDPAQKHLEWMRTMEIGKIFG